MVVGDQRVMSIGKGIGDAIGGIKNNRSVTRREKSRPRNTPVQTSSVIVIEIKYTKEYDTRMEHETIKWNT